MVARRRPPDFLPRDVLERPDFVKACAGRKLGAMLRIAYQWGGPGFSKNHLARRCGLPLSQVSRYMNGRTALRIEIFERVADGLRIPGEMLGMTGRPWERDNDADQDKRRSEDWAYLTPWTVAGTLVSAREVSEVNPVDRRSFILLTGAAVTAPAHGWLLAHTMKDVSGSGGRAIGPALVDDLDDITDKLRGWVSFDGGDYPRAQRFWIAALHAAHTAGDSALGANVLSFMSHQAHWLDKPDDAVMLATTALAGYKGGSPRVSANLHMRVAIAHAARGDTSDSRHAIDSAYDAFRNPPPDSGEPEWCYWMDERDINSKIGECLILLSDYRSASDHLEISLQAEDNRRSSYIRDGVSRLIKLAAARAQQGEPERACEVGTRAIDALSGQVDSARLTMRVQRVRKELRFYQNVPAVREFSDRVDELVAGRSR